MSRKPIPPDVVRVTVYAEIVHHDDDPAKRRRFVVNRERLLRIDGTEVLRAKDAAESAIAAVTDAASKAK